MAATIGPRLVVARSDQLWQLQMARGTTYGSQNWTRTICGSHIGPLVGGTSLRVTATRDKATALLVFSDAALTMALCTELERIYT